MVFAVAGSDEEVNVVNIGSEDMINPTLIGEIIVEEMGLADVKFNNCMYDSIVTIFLLIKKF